MLSFQGSEKASYLYEATIAIDKPMPVKYNRFITRLTLILSVAKKE